MGMKVYRKKIGCLGLSADPPHNGHLEAARLLLKKKVVDEVWLIPCCEHAFGKPLSLARHRWEMARLLGGPKIQAKDIELIRRGKSYTIYTLLELKEKYPDYKFFWVIGSDIAATASFLRWKDWEKLFFFADFLVVSRPGYKTEKLFPNFTLVKSKITTDASSTDIRERVRHGLPIGHLVPPKVKEYIEKHNLYKGS